MGAPLIAGRTFAELRVTHGSDKLLMAALDALEAVTRERDEAEQRAHAEHLRAELAEGSDGLHFQAMSWKARAEAARTALKRIVTLSEDRERFVRLGPRGWAEGERIARAALAAMGEKTP